jgi:hypothetical protein
MQNSRDNVISSCRREYTHGMYHTYSVDSSCYLYVLDEGELHGAVAALGFTLRSAARHGVDSASLDSELQQLGLPRELALAVSRSHADNVAALSKHLATTSLRRKKYYYIIMLLFCKIQLNLFLN